MKHVQSKKNNNTNSINNKKHPVNISTKSVVVNEARSKPKRGRPNKRQRRNRGSPPGVETGLATGSPSNGDNIPPAAAAFVETYVDPCGEHTQSLDGGRAPDGALQTSASLFFRFIETIVLPFQSIGTTDLTGKTYSLLILQLPILRSLSILLVRELDGEFDDAIMKLFCDAFARCDREDSVYPTWVTFGPTDFFTIIDTAAMRSIIPPSGRNGVSPTVDSYRFSSQGFEVLFNTPDLINQGTLTSMRYPSDVSERNVPGSQEPDAIPVLVMSQAVLQLNTNNFQLTIGGATVTLNGVTQAVIPSFVGFSTSLPSTPFPIPTGVVIRRATGVIFATAGQSVQYRLNPTNSRRVELSLVGTVNAESIILVDGSVAGQQTNSVTEFFIEAAGVGLIVTDLDSTISVLSLPPVTQNSMLQANPKSVCQLMKEFDGVYLPSCIFQPVLNITHSSSYRKCVMVNSSVDLAAPSYNPKSNGWFDTIDTNFSVGVANFQGLPYACKPLLKICRSVEVVPSSDSILGAVTTGCPDKCPEALDVCQSFTEKQPHGFPPSFNGLGTLFTKVSGLINSLNVLHRDSRNIAREVNAACDSTWKAAKTIRGTWHSLRRHT
nr:MAG: peptidase A21 family protein [Crogonang virus 92]